MRVRSLQSISQEHQAIILCTKHMYKTSCLPLCLGKFPPNMQLCNTSDMSLVNQGLLAGACMSAETSGVGRGSPPTGALIAWDLIRLFSCLPTRYFSSWEVPPQLPHLDGSYPVQQEQCYCSQLSKPTPCPAHLHR